jgi:RNA polymerase sigma factor (sigma-70 family)
VTKNSLKQQCEQKLVAGVLAGEPQAFTEFVERYQRLVWHLVYRMVQHPEDCRDLCQEVFIRVRRYLPQFRFDSALATWIGRIAYHVSVRHLQRKQVPIQYADDNDDLVIENIAADFDLAAICENAEQMAELHLAIATLAPLPRTVLTLYYLEELTISDVAIITDMPEGTIKNLLFRARGQLRATLLSVGVTNE